MALRKRIPFLEDLESRIALAADVSVVVDGGNLSISGTNSDDSVTVEMTEQDGGDVLVVKGLRDTTLNGGSKEITVFKGAKIPGNLTIDLGDGNDQVQVSGVAIEGSVKIGTAANQKSNADNDNIQMNRVEIGGQLSLQSGLGDDTVLANRSQVAKEVAIETGRGNDRISLLDFAAGELQIRTGAGNDSLFGLNLQSAGPASLVGEDGDDSFRLHGSGTFKGNVTVDGGAGRDVVEVDIANQLQRRIERTDVEQMVRSRVSEFSTAEKLSIRNIRAGDPPGSGATNFKLDGLRFSGGEVSTAGFAPFYASAPASYLIGEQGGTIELSRPAKTISFFFVSSEQEQTAVAYDVDGQVVAKASSNKPTFLGDPGNFVTLAGNRGIARIEISGGGVDNVSVSPPARPTLSSRSVANTASGGEAQNGAPVEMTAAELTDFALTTSATVVSPAAALVSTVDAVNDDLPLKLVSERWRDFAELRDAVFANL